MSEPNAPYHAKPLTPEQEQLARETFAAALNGPECERFEVYRKGRQIKVELVSKRQKRSA